MERSPPVFLVAVSTHDLFRSDNLQGRLAPRSEGLRLQLQHKIVHSLLFLLVLLSVLGSLHQLHLHLLLLREHFEVVFEGRLRVKSTIELHKRAVVLGLVVSHVTVWHKLASQGMFNALVP